MLDTIALTLEAHEFAVREPDRFSPSARGLLEPPYYPLGGRAHFTCTLNPTKTDLAEGRYLPRLTLSKRKRRGGFALTLRVEFSAPKLIFGNNFDELTSRDFERVLLRLNETLTQLGIAVESDTLRAARVSAIHYSKNVAFTDYTTCSMVMGELERIDLDGRLDLSHTDYRNEGHAIRYHANSFEVTFYDKLKDLEKACYSEKRAIEGDYGAQRNLFADRSGFPRSLEVLRMEVRLNSRRKIVSIIEKVEQGTEPTFAALFNAGIAKQVLLHFWREVRIQLPLIEGARDRRPEELLAMLAEAAGDDIRPGALLQQLGSLVLVGSVGFRGARAALSRHCSLRSWQRYKKQLKALPDLAPVGFSALRQVDHALGAFRPLRLADFRDEGTADSMKGSPDSSPDAGHACRGRRP